MQDDGALDVSIILDRANESWVLGKFAERLTNELGVLGHKVNRVSHYRDGHAINLWMYFNSIPLEVITSSPEKRHYAIVTHVNDFSKLSQLKRLLDLGVELIFLSENTFDLVSDSIRSGFEKNIIRLGSDIQNNRPKKIKVSMCSNIYADGRKNEKWLVNLAKNALEAMYDKKRKYTFTVHSEKIKQKLHLAFEDNGPGLPESVQERIFQTFATEGKVNGTGIGLYMAKWTMDTHKGEIQYKTEKGKGTTFTLIFSLGEQS
jgi:signal transduction histidine kinase